MRGRVISNSRNSSISGRAARSSIERPASARPARSIEPVIRSANMQTSLRYWRFRQQILMRVARRAPQTLN